MLSYCDKTANAESKFKTSKSKYISQEYLNIVENRDSNLGKEVNNVRKKLTS